MTQGSRRAELDKAGLLHSLSRRQRLAGASAGSFLVLGATLLVLSTSLSAQTSSSGAHLAQQYLAALTPAGAAISTAEAKLKKLSVTASEAQVKAIVAPLGPALGKLEALTTSATGPTGAGPGLESIGRPTIVGPAGGTTCQYATSGSGAVLQVGYAKYSRGFQLSAPPGCANGFWVNYSWKVPQKYTHFNGEIGLSYSNTYPCATVRVLGNEGRPLQFTTTGGRTLGSMALPSRGVAPVTLSFAGDSVFTIQIDFTCSDWVRSVIDVVNDQLS